MPDPTTATQCTAEFSHVHRTYSTKRPRPAAAAKSRNASPVWCEAASCYSARRCTSRSLAASPGCRFYDCTVCGSSVCSGFRSARGLPVNAPCCSPARCIVTCSEEAQPPRFRAVAIEWWRHTASNVTMSRCQSQRAWKSRSSPRTQLSCLCNAKARLHRAGLSTMHWVTGCSALTSCPWFRGRLSTMLNILERSNSSRSDLSNWAIMLCRVHVRLYLVS
jgi:hypothetical protein